MTVHIRQARASDASEISSLLQAITPLLVPDQDDPEAVAFLETLKEPAVSERLAASNYFYLVAEQDSSLCGYIAIRDGSHLYHLFVRPELHGQGIARLLWQSLLSDSEPRTYTVNSALAAVPVYLSFGFQPTDEPQLHRLPPYLPMKYVAGS